MTRQRVVLTVPAQLRRSAGETRLIVPGRAASTACVRPNPALIKALAAPMLRSNNSAPAPKFHHLRGR